ALPPLPGAGEQGAPHHPRVGSVEQRQPLQALRMLDSEPPADETSPVVRYDAGLAGSGLVDQAPDVQGQGVEVVGRDAPRLVARVVAALVRHHHMKAGGGERLDLLAPAVPELGKAVEQEEERSAFRPGLDDVETDAVGGDRTVAWLQLGLHACPPALVTSPQPLS